MLFVLSTGNTGLPNSLYREYDFCFIQGCFIHINLQVFLHFDSLILSILSCANFLLPFDWQHLHSYFLLFISARADFFCISKSSVLVFMETLAFVFSLINYECGALSSS